MTSTHLIRLGRELENSFTNIPRGPVEYSATKELLEIQQALEIVRQVRCQRVGKARTHWCISPAQVGNTTQYDYAFQTRSHRNDSLILAVDGEPDMFRAISIRCNGLNRDVE